MCPVLVRHRNAAKAPSHLLPPVIFKTALGERQSRQTAPMPQMGQLPFRVLRGPAKMSDRQETAEWERESAFSYASAQENFFIVFLCSGHISLSEKRENRRKPSSFVLFRPLGYLHGNKNASLLCSICPRPVAQSLIPWEGLC